MIRKTIIAIMLCLLMTQPVYAMENTEKSPQDMEQVILHLLSDSMIDAIGDYYVYLDCIGLAVINC